MRKKLRVIELFAGVGGFRLGLEGYQGKSPLSGYKKAHNGRYEIIWSNQFEPASKVKQHASDVYQSHFGHENHSCQDISLVETAAIPNGEVLVGGFPCQDYSVAKSLNSSKGLKGKKGVLWWEIERILREKGDKAPDYLILENVDRLLKSPAKERGRDFSIMLASLAALNYAVEWRVINAADYGFPQKRRRVFILAFKKGTGLYLRAWNGVMNKTIEGYSLLEAEFFCNYGSIDSYNLVGKDEMEITNSYSRKQGNSKSPFKNCGLFVNGSFITSNYTPNFKGEVKVLGDVIEKDVDKEFFIYKGDVEELLKKYPNLEENDLSNYPDLKKWLEAKKSKTNWKITKNGYKYKFSEGNMPFPDSLDSASRTIVTGEGGKGASRFKHVVHVNGILRRLAPVELERLNQFPENFTRKEGISNGKRAFFMGNALVVGVLELIGKALIEGIENYSNGENA